MKKKTTVAKPKVVKPKNKKPKQTKPPQIQIITQKLPRTKCCTDPVKSGQSYTIPLGYTDRLGTMRIGEKPMENIPIPIPVKLGVPPLREPTPEINEVITITEQQKPKRSRRTKKEIENARQMEREDIASYNLGSSIYNFVKPVEEIDNISQISTTPLYEGGRELIEPKPKRQYVKSGKYSKKKTD